MKRNIIHILWMAAVLLTACTQEDFPLPDTGEAVPLSISVTAGGFNGTSRAAENGYRTEFTAGDECGLYIVRAGIVAYENIKLTAPAGTDGSLTWQPAAGVALVGGWKDEKYFIYYPYQAEMKGKTNASATDAEGFFAPLVSGWQPAADQSTYVAYTASDLMTATGTASRVGNQLSLTFSMTHRMAMAVIGMPKTLYIFTDNDDGAIPDCIVGKTADFEESDAKPCRMVDGTYRRIVNPAQSTSLSGIYDGMKEFSLTAGGIGAGCYKTYMIDGATTTEKQTTLQMGDYFCKDNDNKWYIIPQEATPDGNVIGIVFYAGQHESDTGDYSESGIGQEKCHGYVVALTDVHDDENDCLRWEYDPKNEYNQVVGTSTSTIDWHGYSNCLKFHEFVNKDENKEAGWEMKHFPAALACETYGNRTTDQDGNPANGKYDWQKPLAAPQNTSGWFLPSCGQLLHLYANDLLLSARMTDVKNSTPADCNYKGKIKWFNASWTSLYYWSSAESSYDPNCAWFVDFNDGYIGYLDEYYTLYVRAILAF